MKRTTHSSRSGSIWRLRWNWQLLACWFGGDTFDVGYDEADVSAVVVVAAVVAATDGEAGDGFDDGSDFGIDRCLMWSYGYLAFGCASIDAALAVAAGDDGKCGAGLAVMH